MKRATLVVAGGLALLVASAGATAAAVSDTTFLVTRGASMQPAFAAGDLALLQPQAAYEVGDVAGYRSQTLGRVVLHRVAAKDGDVLTFQGDANSFRDPEVVREDAVVGEVALRLPKVGAALLWLASPFNVLLLTALAALGAALARRPRKPASDPLDDGRIVAIDDLAFPHELPITDVVDVPSLLRLAERHDRPVLHDQQRGLLFVLEGTMLFRCRLERTSEPVARLALAQSDVKPPRKREGRRPSLHGPGWDYSRTGS